MYYFTVLLDIYVVSGVLYFVLFFVFLVVLVLSEEGAHDY